MDMCYWDLEWWSKKMQKTKKQKTDYDFLRNEGSLTRILKLLSHDYCLLKIGSFAVLV